MGRWQAIGGEPGRLCGLAGSGEVRIAFLEGNAGGAQAGDQQAHIGRGQGFPGIDPSERGQAGLAAIKPIGDAQGAVEAFPPDFPQRTGWFCHPDEIIERRDFAAQPVIGDNGALAEMRLGGHAVLPGDETGEDSSAGVGGDKFAAGGSERASALDRGDALGVFGIEIAAAFEDFERVFVIGQAQLLGPPGAQQGDVIGHVEGLLPRRFPFEIGANAIGAPGARIILQRRAVIGEMGMGRLGHAEMIDRPGRSVQ